MDSERGGAQAAAVTVRAIEAADVDAVAAFLHTHLNRRVPTAAWSALLSPPWAFRGPNRGFQLIADGRIVGVYAAVYSRRETPSGPTDFCNLAAFCVLETHRAHSLLLVRALTRQRGYVFTDLSPSGNVPAMNERLGFRRLDTRTRLVLTAPARTGSRKVYDDPERLEATLAGQDLEIFRDHRAAAASRHLLIVDGDAYAYVLYRRDRRKRLPVFASPLYVGGDPAVLQAGWRQARAHLLRRGFAAVLAEQRVLGFRATGIGRDLAAPRPKMYKGSGVGPDAIDDLYSELTLLEW
jgi:hypothetical protein